MKDFSEYMGGKGIPQEIKNVAISGNDEEESTQTEMDFSEITAELRVIEYK